MVLEDQEAAAAAATETEEGETASPRQEKGDASTVVEAVTVGEEGDTVARAEAVEGAEDTPEPESEDVQREPKAWMVTKENLEKVNVSCHCCCYC